MIVAIALFIVVFFEINIKQIVIHHGMIKKHVMVFIVQLLSLYCSLALFIGPSLVVGRKSLVELWSGLIRLLLASVLFSIYLLAQFAMLMI